MADPLRVLIVDDEPAAVRRLSRLCATLDTVHVVATASDGEELLTLLEHLAVDLILLDIEMPGLNGMAVAERLVGREGAPSIVFVTAFAQFAIAAFAVDAVGYLLKPVDPLLLSQTIERVTRKAALQPVENADEPVFWVPRRGTLMRLSSQDIDHVQGEGDYARLHVGDSSYLVAERLYEIELRLGPTGFLRAHRSILVNRLRIAGLAHEGGGAWCIVTSAGERLPIGRSYLSAVRHALAVIS